jgi:hypothetical protein
LSETLQSSVLPITENEPASFSAARDTLHSTSIGGGDWRAFSHGVADKKSEAITASNIKLSATDQGTSEEEAHKRKYGWSESGSDEGSLLAEILQAVGGRSATDYQSRALIYGRSAELFGARKTENEDCRR